MIRVLLLVALVTLAACWEDGPSASRETSPGGIEYTLIDLPEHEDVTIHVAWPTDWAYRPGTSKAAPVTGAQVILAGGAEGHPAGEVVERFADLDSEGNIHVAVNDHVIGELTFERDRMAETVKIANAHLRAPTLEQAWFERIRHGIAQNMAEAQARHVHAGFDAVRWAVFGTQPLRNAMSLDEPGTFEALTRDDVAAWHAETFTRSPDAIVVAGGIDAGAAGTALDALFEGLPDSGREVSRESMPDFAPRHMLLHLPYAESTNLAFIAPLPPTRLGGELEDLILVHALGGDDQSVLFDAVRTELRATYGFGAGIANYTREHRILFMTGEVEADRLAEVERVVRAAYAMFREYGPQGSLADRKAPLEASFSELADFVVDQARSELQGALEGHPPGRSLELDDELAAVTEESVMARLRKDFPAAGDFIVIAVSPDADGLPGACVIRVPREAADCP
ncbi:MAG: insulinase family protein [Boseongicola sp. SB0662_bin_57]|nr:insulinase family protein [Boseongicola sp. SB0662_bin_57]